jgi:hypothetical protein
MTDKTPVDPCPECGSTDPDERYCAGEPLVTDLLPCPFCGSAGELEEIAGCGPGWLVCCTRESTCASILQQDKASATKLWNTRTLTRQAQVSDDGLREHRDFWLKSWVELEAAATALVAKIDALSEGECGPFAIKNSIANSPEMDALRDALPSAPTNKTHAEIMAEASPADLGVIDGQVSDDAEGSQ